MEIPRDKNAASPITGKSSARPEGKAVRPEPVAAAPEDSLELDDIDLDIRSEVFEQPVISLPPRAAPREAPKGVFKDLNPPPPDTKEVEERVSKKRPLERRSGDGMAAFKRFVTRPETAYTAHAASDQAKAETPVPTERVDRATMQFGKIHSQSNPDYRPNRLFRVLDGIYVHSPLKWIDFLDRSGSRVLVAVLLVTAGGFIGWRYLDSLKDRETSTAQVKETVVSADDRVERGKKAVQAYLSAQTLEAKLPHVMDRDRAAPRMKEFYANASNEDPKVMAGWEVGQPVSGTHGAWLPFTFQDNHGRKVTVALAESDAGCQLDWENFTAFGEANWGEFCKTRPPGAKAMRVRLRKSNNYAGTYTREAWQSYEIEHRSGGPKLTGYSGRNDRSAQALAEVVKGEQWQSAQVYLRFESSGGGDGTLVVIDDVIRSRWQDEVTSWTDPAAK